MRRLVKVGFVAFGALVVVRIVRDLSALSELVLRGWYDYLPGADHIPREHIGLVSFVIALVNLAFWAAVVFAVWEVRRRQPR